MTKKKPTDDERIKDMVKAMTSETEGAPNEDKAAHALEETFGLGDSGDINQAVQDENVADDEDPYGTEDEDDDASPGKLASSKSVLKGQKSPKLFNGGKDVTIIIRGGK